MRFPTADVAHCLYAIASFNTEAAHMTALDALNERLGLGTVRMLAAGLNDLPTVHDILGGYTIGAMLVEIFTSKTTAQEVFSCAVSRISGASMNDTWSTNWPTCRQSKQRKSATFLAALSTRN